MKKSVIAIVILSILLSASIAYIIFARGKLADANKKVEAAQREKYAIALTNVEISKQNATLQASYDAKVVENKKQSVTIAELKAASDAIKNISKATIEAGANVQKAFDAGKPIITTINVPSLTEWYTSTGLLIPPLLLNIADLTSRNDEQALRIDILTVSNAKMQGLLDADKGTISDQTMSIHDQSVSIDALGIDLDSAHADLASALHTSYMDSLFIWTLSGAVVGSVSGATIGKSGLSSLEGAAGGAVGGFLVKLLGDLLHIF